MIKLDKYRVNPFLRNTYSPSYVKNIGNKYPALHITNCTKHIRVYDGILYIDENKIDELEKHTIGSMYKLLKDNGIEVKVFPGMKNLPAISMINFSNKDIVNIEINQSPIDIPLYKSKYLMPTSLDNYFGNTKIEFEKTSALKITSATLRGNKLYVDSSDIGKTLTTIHTGINFIMLMSDQNIIRDIERVSHIPNVKQSLISWNRKVKGDVNAGINIRNTNKNTIILTAP